VSNHVSMSYPDYKELLQGCAGYIEDEKRDAMYKLALRLVSEAKWKPEELAEGVGVLLLTWNAAFYTKYGSFDFDKLEDFIGKRIDDLKVYSNRSILSYSKTTNRPERNTLNSTSAPAKPAAPSFSILRFSAFKGIGYTNYFAS